MSALGTCIGLIIFAASDLVVPVVEETTRAGRYTGIYLYHDIDKCRYWLSCVLAHNRYTGDGCYRYE